MWLTHVRATLPHVRPGPNFFALVAGLAVFGWLLGRTEPFSATPWMFVFVVWGWVLSLVLHEFGHAFCRRGHSASRRSGLGATDGDAIAGLDGFGAIEPWLSSAALRRADRIRPYTFMVLIAILIGVPDVAESLFGIADRFAGAQDLPGEVWASYALSQFEFWN